jgi:hypothetical protein
MVVATTGPRLVRPRARRGTRVRLDSGGVFEVFRETTVAGLPVERPAVLAVRFHLRAMGPRQRRLHRLFQRVCILTTPFFVRTPGYRTRLWAHDAQTGDYAGVYQWDGADRAEAYAHSLAPILRALSRRGSVSYRIYAGERLDDHLAAHR